MNQQPHSHLRDPAPKKIDAVQDVWWVRISITTHYNSIHMTVNCQQGHWGSALKKKHTTVPAFCVIYSSSSLRLRCFTLCEQPMAENWPTVAAAIMPLLCVKKANYTCYVYHFMYVMYVLICYCYIYNVIVKKHNRGRSSFLFQL